MLKIGEPAHHIYDFYLGIKHQYYSQITFMDDLGSYNRRTIAYTHIYNGLYSHRSLKLDQNMQWVFLITPRQRNINCHIRFRLACHHIFNRKRTQWLCNLINAYEDQVAMISGMIENMQNKFERHAQELCECEK